MFTTIKLILAFINDALIESCFVLLLFIQKKVVKIWYSECPKTGRTKSRGVILLDALASGNQTLIHATSGLTGSFYYLMVVLYYYKRPEVSENWTVHKLEAIQCLNTRQDRLSDIYCMESFFLVFLDLTLQTLRSFF